MGLHTSPLPLPLRMGSSSALKFAFGTYRVKGEVLDIAIGQAMYGMTKAGIDAPLLDTALLYNNTASIQAVATKMPHIRIGSKVHRKGSVREDVALECEKYSAHGPLARLLLHRHMPGLASYMHLIKAKAEGKVLKIGVSNYTTKQLEELIALLSAAGDKGELPLPLEQCMPDVVQNEFHPFLRSNVPGLCKQYGIEFEAHSVFSRLQDYPKDILEAAGGKSAAQLAMAYAIQRGGGSVVFNTTNWLHLCENLECELLDEEILMKLDEVKNRVGIHARYPGSDVSVVSVGYPHHLDPASDWFHRCDLEFLRTTVAKGLKEDIKIMKEGGCPSELAVAIPKYRVQKMNDQFQAHKALAEAFLGETPSEQEDRQATMIKIQKLEAALHKLRQRINQQKKEKQELWKPKVCKLGQVEEPDALPVEIPDPKVLQPFIDLVKNSKELPETAVRMTCGTLFPDGRLDFCKQVAQPSFEQLCDAVLESGAIKHFLIGNNVVLRDDDDGQREAALARLITECHGISTWYLAGNSIDKDQIKSVAEALAGQPDARFVWLKMNPVKTGSYHLGRMLFRNPHIELLDLFNTGQCDEGVDAFYQGLCDERAEQDKDNRTAATSLQHLYFDINGITSGAGVGRVAVCFPMLETLSLNVNQLGDKGGLELLECLRSAGLPLKRLVIGSNGFTDAFLSPLTEYVRATPTLCVVQLGSYRSTRYFQHADNSFTSHELMLALGEAVRSNAEATGHALEGMLGFQHAFAGEGATELTSKLAALGLNVNGVQWEHQGFVSSATDETKGLMSKLVAPPPVEFIQSVYRNAM